MCFFCRNVRLRAFRCVEIVLSKGVFYFSSHRQSSTGGVVVAATCATTPLFQIASKTKQRLKKKIELGS